MKGINFHFKVTNENLKGIKGEQTLRIGVVRVILDQAEKEKQLKAIRETFRGVSRIMFYNSCIKTHVCSLHV